MSWCTPRKRRLRRALADHAAHLSPRCTRRDDSCVCGLDALTDELGLPRVELTCWPEAGR